MLHVLEGERKLRKKGGRGTNKKFQLFRNEEEEKQIASYLIRFKLFEINNQVGPKWWKKMNPHAIFIWNSSSWHMGGK